MTKQARPSTTASHRRRRRHDRNNHQQMNGPAPAHASSSPSKAHHGQEGAGAKSGSMDISSGASHGHATPASSSQPEVMNSSSTDAPPPPSLTTPSTNIPIKDSPSLKSSSNPSPLPTISISQPPPPPGEPVFNGPLLLCHKAHERSKPHVEQDIFGLYGLTPLAQGVARRDLATGAKINPMRKTYAGQIKTFQLAGKNKAFPHSEGGIGISLAEMVAWPQPEWQNQKLSGKDVSKGLSSGAVSKLEKALKLEPGPVPKNDEWESVLGLEKVKHAPLKSESKGATPAAPGMKLSKPNGVSNGAVKGPAEAEMNRPKRAGKKRRYNDDSFEGYGEGYDDDVDGGDGYSSGDGSRRGGQKKRRKDYASLNSPIGSGVGGYAAGLVSQSVGRGIGAYGSR